MKIVSVMGARPQFVKGAVVSRALRARPGVVERIVHTGQHYDPAMTDVFFNELNIPQPDHNLGIGSANHGAQTGRMLERIESVLERERPDWVVVYGDTNSTLAGALAAAKLHMPVAHVEAGLRSYNRRMPEEINRVLTDHISTLLFAPTIQAVENLKAEGIADDKIKLIGDVMYDAALFYSETAMSEGPATGEFILATVHRAENTDNRKRLEVIINALGEIGERFKVIMPVHPRVRNAVEGMGVRQRFNGRVQFIEPVSYRTMVALERRARLIVTDSGGVQKEAYFFQIPCVTIREETEWTELVSSGWNRLAPPDDVATIRGAVDQALALDPAQLAARNPTPLYGDGRAGEKIADTLSGSAH